MNEGNKGTSSNPFANENTSTFFDEIIIISDKEECIPADTDFLDATIIPFSAPENALYYILAQKENNISYSALILCEYSFGDFDAALLISLLRLHPLGILFPVGVIFNTAENNFDEDFIAKEKMNLKALGASFFLVYPFSFKSVSVIARELFMQHKESTKKYYANLQALENAPEEKRKLFHTNWEQKINNFEKGFVRFFYTPDENANYEELFAIGQQKYQDKLYRQASTCFERSSSEESPHKSDSFAYLYTIEKEQGQPEKGRAYLERAVNAFIDNGEWEKAAHSAELFSEDFPEEQNPLYPAIQKNFAHTNYGTVNKILEAAQKILPAEDIAGFLLQMNGSKKFPPVIAKYLDKHRDLQQIIFSSRMKDLVLDGDEYRREQERIRAITYLEKQRLERIHGKKSTPENAQANKAKASQTNAPDSDQKELLAALSLNLAAENANFPDETEQTDTAGSDANSREKIPQLHPVEDMPTVMLDAKGSFLGDMINMVKYTRTLYKKK